MFGQCEDDGWHEVQRGDFEVLDGFEEEFEFELGHDGGSVAAIQAREEYDDEAIDVEEGENADKGRGGGDVVAVDCLHLDDVRDDVVMSEHDALGQASGAAGVGDASDIVGLVRGRIHVLASVCDESLECNRSAGRH